MSRHSLGDREKEEHSMECTLWWGEARQYPEGTDVGQRGWDLKSQEELGEMRRERQAGTESCGLLFVL